MKNGQRDREENRSMTDSGAKTRVLITGASGNIGKMLTSRFADRYDLVLLGTRDATTEEGLPVHGADVRDLDALVPHMGGVDTVVHLAGDASPQATWESVSEVNILGTRNVLEAARLAGVRRVVFASSNHAMGMYDRDGQWPVYTHQLPRPDSLYGVSKVFGETIGRFYHDEYGLEFIALRIGWSTKDVGNIDDDVLHAMWLSPDDTARVIRCAIEAKVPFGIYYAISDNPNRRWDLTNTMLELGYRPQDSWEDALGLTEEVVEGGRPADPNWPNPS
jgi:NAD+ dependent glucose-6-phosphate dehydrogenase